MKPVRLSLITATALAGGLVIGPASAQSVEAFYKGKVMNLYVGSAPGGGYDTYGRAVARHIADHIPGNPSIVVKNMPGASGLRLAGYMYNAAKKTGIEIAGIHNTAVVDQLLGSKVQFDARQFNWLGSANQLTSTCVAQAKTGITTVQQAMEKELLVGATGSSSSSTQLVAAFMNSLTGTKFKIIKGYPSTSSVFLAMERGEVGGLCGIGWDSLQAQVLEEIKAGKIVILVQTGTVKHPDLKDVPLVLDLAKNDTDRTVLEFLVARQYMGRPYVAPPGTPADRVAALRTAFTATMNDPKFKATAKKSRVPLSPITGQQVQDHVAKLFTMPKSIIDRANAATQVNPSAIADAKLTWKTAKGATIGGVKKRKLQFTDGGKKVTADLSGTSITVKGKKAKRSALKAGMVCDVTYLGDGDAAGKVTCN
ncbi:MAG: Bug family tripartite tricarboxylate transporter substrate binding protein [Alphaproteobacteria bacterium]